MNNPGLLHQAQEDGVFCPWYNSKRDKRNRVILDSRGRCTRVDAKDEWYSFEEVRYAQGDNITPGYYLPYSEDQFDSLVAIIAFLKDKFPNDFDINKVFGHDEVSPGRKQDPGGALAYDGVLMTMPQFRRFLESFDSFPRSGDYESIPGFSDLKGQESKISLDLAENPSSRPTWHRI